MSRDSWIGSAAESLVVIPTLGDRIGYLEQTLRSLQEQSVPVDVAVVTPLTADAARRLAEDFGAKVLDDPGGLSAAVNLGMQSAAPRHLFGNWVGDDDLLAPGAVERASSVLRSRPDVAVVFGHCSYIDGAGRELWVSRAGRLAPAMLGWGPNLIPQPGMLFRLEDFRAVGSLDEGLRYSMDLDLLLRLKTRGRLFDLGEPVSSFRWHADSLTVSSRRDSLAESEAVKRRYLGRRAHPWKVLWERPVRIATYAAVRSMARRGRRAVPGATA